MLGCGGKARTLEEMDLEILTEARHIWGECHRTTFEFGPHAFKWVAKMRDLDPILLNRGFKRVLVSVIACFRDH